MTKLQKISLIYFVTGSFFLASGYSLIFNTSSYDSWISMIIGSIIGLFIIILINSLGFNKIRSYILKIKLSKYYKFIFSLFFLFIIFVNTIILRIFTTSFYLTKTPGWFITIPYIILCFYNAKKGIKCIAKEAQILMPISFIFIVLNMLGVCKDGSIDYFLPIMTTPFIKVLLGSIYYAILTAIPQLLLFDIKIQKKDHIKGYLFITSVLVFIGTIIIFVLGPSLIKIYRFPEYMVLKQLKLFNFVEKIENLVGLIWFFDLFISSSISLYNLDKTLKNNKLFIILSGLIILIVEIFTYHYEFVMFLYKYMPIILFIIGFVFFISLLFIRKKKIA